MLRASPLKQASNKKLKKNSKGAKETKPSGCLEALEATGCPSGVP